MARLSYEQRHGHSRTRRATHPLREQRRQRAKERKALYDAKKLALLNEIKSTEEQKEQ